MNNSLAKGEVVVQSSVMSDSATPWTAALQASLFLTISWSSLKLTSTESMIHQTISSSVILFSSCPQSFPASGSFLVSWLFTSSGQRIGASASVLPMNIQGWFPLGLLVWSPCCPRDSQESFLVSQFEGINSLVLSLLCGPTLTSIHDYWKNHSFDYMDLCRQMEMQVQSLGQEDSLKEEMAAHSSILAWEIPYTEEPGELQSMGSPKSQTWLIIHALFKYCKWIVFHVSLLRLWNMFRELTLPSAIIKIWTWAIFSNLWLWEFLLSYSCASPEHFWEKSDCEIVT